MSSEPRLSVVAIIPARFSSSRFPGKPLALICGEPMIAHVIRRARRARLVDEVWVATDDERIAAVATAEGVRAVMTSRGHRSGTDRVAEAAAVCPAEIIVNLQGDEPLIDPRALDRLARALLEDPRVDAATLAFPLRSRAEWLRPDVVKVVVAEDGRALYFSRAPVPHHRARPDRMPRGALKHLGLYAFRRDLLRRFTAWGPSPLEKLEGLEQLRLLEHGVRLQVVAAPQDSIAVDRPQDVAAVERRLRAKMKQREKR